MSEIHKTDERDEFLEPQQSIQVLRTSISTNLRLLLPSILELNFHLGRHLRQPRSKGLWMILSMSRLRQRTLIHLVRLRRRQRHILLGILRRGHSIQLWLEQVLRLYMGKKETNQFWKKDIWNNPPERKMT